MDEFSSKKCNNLKEDLRIVFISEFDNKSTFKRFYHYLIDGEA